MTLKDVFVVLFRSLILSSITRS